MVWLKRMIKAPTCAERSCMAIVLLLFYLSPVLFFLWSFPGSLSISELILKAFVITLLKRKHPFNSLSFGSLLNRVHICIYTAWIGRRDLPLPGLSCCLVKYFNISGSELVAGSTRIKICRNNQMQSTQGGGGRCNHSRCRNCCCLQRCWICAGRPLHQRLVRIWNMCS